MHNYSKWDPASSPIGDNLMAQIEAIAQKQLDCEALVESLEEQLKEAKEALRGVQEQELPELLSAAQLEQSTVNTPSGKVITVADKVYGSIPVANRPEAFKWLEANNNAALIRRTFTVDFPKDAEEWAARFEALLAKEERPLNVKKELSVNPQSLHAFIRQALAKGQDVPLTVFGVMIRKKATVKLKETQ